MAPKNILERNETSAPKLEKIMKINRKLESSHFKEYFFLISHTTLLFIHKELLKKK
jgi:hypothetical protein